MASKKAKQQSKNYDYNPIEAIRDMGSTLVNTPKEEGKELLKSLWGQLLNPEGTSKTQSGELTEGQELFLSQIFGQPKSAENFQKQPEKKDAFIEAGYDYRSEIIHSEKRISQENTHGIANTIEEIRVEIKKLASSSKQLQTQFRSIGIEQMPQNPGKYHVNFFEWLLSVVRDARIRIDDSENWLSTMKNKASKKVYWGMFKKHGTSFGLSGERMVATQTG